MQPKVKLRPAMKEDLNFILNSWLKSYRSSPFAAKMINKVYFSNHQEVIKSILADNLITVACNPEDEGQIFGYMVFNTLPGNVLLIHYTYIKHTYRRMGIAKFIYDAIKTDDLGVLYTHHTKYADFLSNKLTLIFDPYRI